MRPEVLERVPAHTRKGLEAANAGKPLAQPGAIEAVLKRLETESVAAIAKDLGISEVAMYKALLLNAPGEWQAIQAAKSLKKLDNSDSELDACTDGVMLGRARERIGLAKWNLERTARTLYGDSGALQLSGEQLGDLLMSVSSRMLAEKQVEALPGDNKEG